jgi:hypothetical protein
MSNNFVKRTVVIVALMGVTFFMVKGQEDSYVSTITKIYRTDANTKKSQLANLDGKEIEDSTTTGLSEPGAIALAPVPIPGAALVLGCLLAGSLGLKKRFRK